MALSTLYCGLSIKDAFVGATYNAAKALKREDSIGLLKEGYKADINVIDYENLTLHEPEIINDLPAGGRRLVQKASGYEYTIVSGEVAFKDGEPTGVLNGRLIRSLH